MERLSIKDDKTGQFDYASNKLIISLIIEKIQFRKNANHAGLFGVAKF